MTDFERLLTVLTHARVEFIVIGGFAATAHGSAHITVDLDLVYRRTPENIDRLAGALEPLQPYLRGVPRGLPFRFDGDTIRQGLNFTLTTLAGDLDLLGDATGGAGRTTRCCRIPTCVTSVASSAGSSISRRSSA